jgi:hypothetical protein
MVIPQVAQIHQMSLNKKTLEARRLPAKKKQLAQRTLSVVHQEGHLNSGLRRGWAIRMQTNETSCTLHTNKISPTLMMLWFVVIFSVLSLPKQ